jgi:molybdopterin converting factor small subunit
VLDAVAADHPVFDRRVRDESGALRRHVNVYVGGEDVRRLDGLSTPVGPDDEVMIIQSVAGG